MRSLSAFRILLALLPFIAFAEPADAGWTSCATEYGTCSFSGTRRVSYGVTATSQNAIKTFASSVKCDNTNFGDPAPGLRKHCWFEDTTAAPAPAPAPAPASGWTSCATEYGTCSFSGTRRVSYGIAPTSQNFVRTLTASAVCDNETFGDPAPGLRKYCWYENSTTNVPAPAPAPAPTTAPTSSPSWVSCATEYGTCAFSGTRRVSYGITPTSQNFVRTLTSSAVCDNETFGDPAPGLRKYCWYEGVASAPAPAPEPTSNPVPPASGGGFGPRVSSFTNSGPIVAYAGQVISGVRIQNPNGACITIDVPNVVVRDSDIGPCGGQANINVGGGGANALIEYNRIREGGRGVMARSTRNVTTANNIFTGEYYGGNGPIDCRQEDGRNNGCSSAIEYDYMLSGTIDHNQVRGQEYGTDAISLYQTHGTRVINNDVDVGLYWKHASPFMIGDSYAGGDPGHDNYIAGNVIRGRGGVPAGILGSSGNTTVIRNCFANGLQAYAYNGNPMIGVTLRDNVIDMSKGRPNDADASVLIGWSTNINSSDCSRVP